jgi:hypothetical protein
MSSQANVFNLHNSSLHISYATGALGSKAGLTYQDALQTLKFDEQQMRRVQTDLGEEVSVTIRLTPDAGSTTFTLVVPSVALEVNQHVHITTIGITALHRFSIAPPLLHGQLVTYSVSRLQGTASATPF